MIEVPQGRNLKARHVSAGTAEVETERVPQGRHAFLPHMPELTVVIVATDSEQRTVLQVLVDGTSVASTIHTCASFPVATSDPIMRRVQAGSPDVLLVDIPADNPAPAMRAIELLRQELPDSAVFAIGSLNQPQVIVSAMRAGAREFIERPTTTTDLLGPSSASPPLSAAFKKRARAAKYFPWSTPKAAAEPPPSPSISLSPCKPPTDRPRSSTSRLSATLRCTSISNRYSILPTLPATFTAWIIPCSRVS